MKKFFFAIIVFVLLASALGEGMRPFFDGRLNLEPTQPSRSEQWQLEKLVRPAAKKHWVGDSFCDDDFRVIDTASGAFTRPNSRQRLFLYRLCITGHNFARNGLAVFEAGKLIAHVVYEGAWDYAVGVLPDIKRNGLNEIIVATGGTNAGETWSLVTLLELPGGAARPIGMFDVYDDTCGTGSTGTDERVQATRLWVTPGAIPTFFRQSFDGACGSKGFGKGSKITSVAPRKNGVSYERIF
jgi:hypothetical protein